DRCDTGRTGCARDLPRTLHVRHFLRAAFHGLDVAARSGAARRIDPDRRSAIAIVETAEHPVPGKNLALGIAVGTLTLGPKIAPLTVITAICPLEHAMPADPAILQVALIAVGGFFVFKPLEHTLAGGSAIRARPAPREIFIRLSTRVPHTAP